jgi:hypothetical protein
MATVHRKTAKGLSEIETRAHRLPPRLRSALILVDGRRADDELAKLIPGPAEEILTTLRDQGFIEAVTAMVLRPPAASMTASPTAPMPAPMSAPAMAPASPPATAPASPAFAATTPVLPSAAGVPFEQRRREAVRRLTDLVGPMAEALTLRMERSRTPEELRALVATAAQVIANTRGRATAQDYFERFGDL